MVTIESLREHLLPVSPQAAIDHWVQIFEKYNTDPDFENPRVTLAMKSGMIYSGYLVSSGTEGGAREKHLILSMVLKNDTDQGRDIAYINYSDIESIAFYDIDHVLKFLPRK